MASTVRIKTHGNATLEGLELENFATEETLSALLEQFKSYSGGFSTTSTDQKDGNKKTHTYLEKLISGLGGATTPTANKTTENVTKVLAPVINQFIPFGTFLEELGTLTPDILAVAVAFKAISFGLKTFQAALNVISRSITSVFSVTGNLVGTLISGKTALSDYFTAISRGTESLPIIGAFTSLLADGFNSLEIWNQSVIDLTKMGANFGGSLTDLVIGAADAGLSVEQFSRIIKEHSDSLMTFGSVMNGVNVYTRVSKIAMQDYSNQLAELGISFSQYSEELPKILGLFGASALAHSMSDKQLTQSSIDLITQFDAMSNLTGKSRDQQASDLQKLTEDAAWQQKMTHMSGDEAAKYAQVLNEISNTSGNAYAELYKLTVLGMPPLTKELQTLLATTPGLNTEFQRMTAIVKSGVSGEQLGEQLDNVAADMVSTGIKAGQSFENLIAASTAGLTGSASDIAAVQKDLLANKLSFFNNGVFDTERYRKQLDQDRRRLDANNEITKNLNSFSILLVNLRDTIYEQVVGPIVKQIAPLITIIVDELYKNIGSFHGIVNMVVGWVDDFSKWITTTDLKTDIDDLISTIKIVISAVVVISKFVWEITKIIAEHWKFIAASIVGWSAFLTIGSGVGLGIIFYTFFDSLTAFTAAIRAATAVIAENSIGGNLNNIAKIGKDVASAEAVADVVTPVTSGAIDIGAEAGGLGTLVGAEASTGVGIPLALTTAAIGGGALLLWQFFSKKNEDEKKKETSTEKQKNINDQADTLAKLNDAMMKLHDLQMENNRHLLTIADNTGASVKYGRKTFSVLQ